MSKRKTQYAIPRIMNSEPIGLQHQELITSKIEALGFSISEYNFANLYLFRSKHDYEVVFAKKLYIKGISYDKIKYYMPLEKISVSDFLDLQQTLGESVTLFPLPESWLSTFHCPQFIHESLSQDSDYIYKTEHMRTYAGRGLSGQRNQVKQFLSLYNVKVLPLNIANQEKAIHVLELWRHKDEEADFSACLEAIHRHQELGLSGQIFLVDDQPAALIIGNALTSQMFLMQFAKADVQYKGIYQFAYQHYVQSLDLNYHFLNMEEDLGIPGLHKTKMSYHPEKLETKWRIRSQ